MPLFHVFWVIIVPRIAFCYCSHRLVAPGLTPCPPTYVALVATLFTLLVAPALTPPTHTFVRATYFVRLLQGKLFLLARVRPPARSFSGREILWSFFPSERAVFSLLIYTHFARSVMLFHKIQCVFSRKVTLSVCPLHPFWVLRNLRTAPKDLQ